MTGDTVKKETMVLAQLSDLELAFKVRMLCRSDLDHEPVCTGARDRIMYLSQQNQILTDKVEGYEQGTHALIGITALGEINKRIAELEADKDRLEWILEWSDGTYWNGNMCDLASREAIDKARK